MKTILLRPTDVLFFRDGRPMEGSLSGHGAAWPLPHVISGAFHAALHRADIKEVHSHRRGRAGKYDDTQRDRKFGSLITAGPFPFLMAGSRTNGGPKSPGWYFPRPLDLLDSTLGPALLPSQQIPRENGSLAAPLNYAVANVLPPQKDRTTTDWLSRDAFEAYIQETKGIEANGVNDRDVFDQEHHIGIGIDAETQTTGQGEAEGKIYSAHYLRLRDEWRLGVFARALDKGHSDQDLLNVLFENGSRQIIVGGQQRVCTVEFAEQEGSNQARLPLPLGISTGFRSANGKIRVKWVLLSPAIWPEITAGVTKKDATVARHGHPGGWLPNWIDAENGNVLLRSVTAEERKQRRSDNYDGRGYRSERNAEEINAKLVAAIVPKPIPVTGWALPSETADHPEGGAKSTHLAVPAGAVYYFEADTVEDAERLANALNWHGASKGVEIKNRRSTLLGEKGFGLGVCGTWRFYGT